LKGKFVIIFERRLSSLLISFLVFTLAAATSAQTAPQLDKRALPEMWVKLPARLDLEKLRRHG